MDYSQSYRNATSLAQRIRESAASGQAVKGGSGLASRLRTSDTNESLDYNNIVAQYVGYVGTIFQPLREAEATEEVRGYLNDKNDAKYPTGENPLAADTGKYPVGKPAGDDFLSKLIQSESSGRRDAKYTTRDGRSFVGLVQMGKARLEEYNQATGSSIEQADLIQNEKVEADVINWHISDLTKRAEKLSEETGLNVQGLVAVGHLGGWPGMNKFARTNGKYNPSDELGTSLLDYYTKFKG